MVIVACRLCYFGFVLVLDVFQNLVFGKSSIFHSLRNHEVLVRGLFYQNTQNHLVLGRGGNFFPLLSGDVGCSLTTKWTGIAFRSVRAAQFLVVLHNFARIFGSPNNPEIGVRLMCFMISSKPLYQIVRPLLRFVDSELPLPAVFIGFSSCSNQKDINV